VAAAIEQHSNAFADPVGRFHRTFSTVFAMVFGALDQSVDAARRLHRRHAGLRDLIETASIAYELVLPPLTGRTVRECR
jgi:uncharacterized protein (DUF2236 family)